MDFDDIALKERDDLRHAWIEKFSKSSEGICKLASRWRENDDCVFRSIHCGSFNQSIRLHWDDGQQDWLIRFPIPGRSMLCDEKTRNEVAVMKFIEQNTSIPVPHVVAYGNADENPTGLGPFIIMTFVEGRKMSEILKAKTSEEGNVLDPNIDEAILKTLYGQMADILLELSSHSFDHIGSLDLNEESGCWSVKRRPLGLELNEILRCSHLPEDRWPTRVYSTSADYLLEMSELRLIHLRQQRNSVDSSRDCRQKYVSRHLFRSITPHFINCSENYGPFKLYCEDLCPGNVIVDESLRIKAVIDWEFCYAAPAQFSSSPPWWLLLDRPDEWLSRISPDDFLRLYTPKFELFSRIIEEKESARAGCSTNHPSEQLSAQMRHSMESRTVWFNLAARSGYGFDQVYWDLLDEFCFGPRASIAERVTKATTNVGMYRDREQVVRWKIKDLQEYLAAIGSDEEVRYEPEYVQVPTTGHHRGSALLAVRETDGRVSGQPLAFVCDANSHPLDHRANCCLDFPSKKPGTEPQTNIWGLESD
jgi:hypothetical protein